MTLQKVVEFDRNILGLHPIEIAVSAATTLTATAFGRWHYCTGASFTLKLPTRTAGVNKPIGIRVPASATATVVTVQRSDSDTGTDGLIEGWTSITLSSGDSIILVPDGTIWHIREQSQPARFAPKLLPNAIRSAYPIVVNAGWNYTFDGVQHYPRILVPAVETPPSGYSWLLDISGALYLSVCPAGMVLCMISVVGEALGGLIHGGSYSNGSCGISVARRAINVTPETSDTVFYPIFTAGGNITVQASYAPSGVLYLIRS